jgi:hypothetical protein
MGSEPKFEDFSLIRTKLQEESRSCRNSLIALSILFTICFLGGCSGIFVLSYFSIPLAVSIVGICVLGLGTVASIFGICYYLKVTLSKHFYLRIEDGSNIREIDLG